MDTPSRSVTATPNSLTGELANRSLELPRVLSSVRGQLEVVEEEISAGRLVSNEIRTLLNYATRLFEVAVATEALAPFAAKDPAAAPGADGT